MRRKKYACTGRTEHGTAAISRREFMRQASTAAAGIAVPCIHAPCAFDERPVGDIVLRFATASDGHYGGTDRDDVYHADLARWLNNEKKKTGLDFFIHLGDVAHHPHPAYEKELARVKNILFDSLAMEAYAAPGNHDRTGDSAWKNIFGHPRNHAFERGHCGFIIAGSTDRRTGAVQCPDGKTLPWLRNQLALFSSKKYVFYFAHVFPFRDIRGGQITVSCPEVTELLHRTKNIIASYHGHMHVNDQVIGKDICGRTLHYCFHGRFGWTWGVLYRGYRITEIYKNGTVFTYQYSPESRQVSNSDILAQAL